MTIRNTWHDDPHLRERFHTEHPDTLQVLVHDGGPRFSDTSHELMWVKVVGQQAEAYEGKLLNVPQGLKTATLGSKILFLAVPNANPFRVTEKYLTERSNWNILPCDGCGFAELFDAPSDLIQKVFPTLQHGDVLEGFTSFCPLCGGVQVVEYKKADTSKSRSGRQWWQLWK